MMFSYILGILDIENALHKYLLHFIFVPRINHVIKGFVKGWNCHPLRNEHNWSPEKLWSNGMLDLRNSSIQHVSEMDQFPEDFEFYGMDWHSPSPTDDGLTVVDVLDVDMPISAEMHEQLSLFVNPMSESSSYGIDLFIISLEFVEQMT